MNVGHSLRLTRIDVRRMVRKRTDPNKRLASVVSVGLFALLTLGLTAGGVYGGRALGRALASGSLDFAPAAAAEAARGFFGVMWVIGVVLFAVRAVGQRGTLTNAEGVLTVVPTVEAYVGLVASEFAYLLIWTLLPAVGAGAGLALGTETLWPAAGVPLAVAFGGATAVTAAYAIGLGIRHVVTRFPFVARHKNGLIALVFVLYMAAIVSGSLNQAVAAIFEPMAASPVGWYADLGLLGLPNVSADATRAAGTAVASVAFVAVAAAAGTAVARRHWFADPALAGEDEDDPEPADTGASGAADAVTPATTDDDWLARRLETVVDRPTAALAVLAWRRAARSPLKMMYAAYPLFFGTGAFVDILQTGEIPVYLPYALLVFVAWAGGVVFTLNPLGDQGSVLSTTILSEVTGRTFVFAHVLAGLIVVVPVGTVLVGAVAALSPVGAEKTAILVGLSPVAMVVAAGLSVGIGTAFPRFEATNVTRSMEAVVPSPWAFVLFSAHVVLTAVAAVFVGLRGARELGATLIGALGSFALSTQASLAPSTLYTVSAAALVVLLLLPALSYRYAVRTFDRYELA
ncbi:hypothetical protein C475_00435 [Halosimplex carlsbadense 2-9-1]|uniref:Uncharacterized protein n=1 Tax=Halosimplex carlsbadense 2-9-1 TaxID=797114 RepID=M0D546_9EURY|nr:hypothetical protein [Halosimplex carlsbadense]ELZ30565.1 hypothetical protein C475_00435 [Halosimplex carlsbadense 2-9-1]